MRTETQTQQMAQAEKDQATAKAAEARAQAQLQLQAQARQQVEATLDQEWANAVNFYSGGDDHVPQQVALVGGASALLAPWPEVPPFPPCTAAVVRRRASAGAWCDLVHSSAR